MALVESLLTAIVRTDGDALVMHVGEKPYVVASAAPIELSTQGLNLEAMQGMLQQLLPADSLRALEEFGAVEHELSSRAAMQGDRFTVVAARGGDDVWIEMRRHRRTVTPVVITPPPAASPRVSEPAPKAPRVDIRPAPELALDDAAEIEILDTPAYYGEEEEEVAALTQVTRSPSYDERLASYGEVDEDEPIVLTKESAPVLNTPPAVVPSGVARPDAPSSVGPSTSAGPPPAASRDGETASKPLREIGPAAPVIPLTRTLRIEVPPKSITDRQAGIERLLSIAAARGASALYLTCQARPYLRVDGDIRPLDGEQALTSADIESAVLELMPETGRDAVRKGEAAEWVCEFAEIGRLRCTTFRDYRGPGALFHLISARPLSADALGLSREIQALATETEGLVLIASPRAGGKSTLVSGFVDLINRQRSDYVITLERQIRLVHENRMALISQREVRGNADQVSTVARGALRENPDVLVIDDLPSPDIFQLALDAAGTGLLVFATVTAGSTAAALSRVLDIFPPDRRKAVQSALAERLRGAIAQVLLRKTGGGRLAARELMVTTSAVASLLADGQVADLPLALESGRKHGMVPLTDALLAFVRSGAVDVREAYRKADDRTALLNALKREGVDTSFVERLA